MSTIKTLGNVYDELHTLNHLLDTATREVFSNGCDPKEADRGHALLAIFEERFVEVLGKVRSVAYPDEAAS